MRRLPLLLFILTSSAAAQDLLVSARFSNNILRYDANTGAFKSVFASGNGLLNPNGIAIGPDGNLYAGLGDEGTVLRFDGQTGAFIDRFVTDTTGTFRGCRGIEFGPDGNLYVDDGPGDRVLKFDGRTGAPLGVAAQSTDMHGPVGLAIASDGTMYVGGALDNAIHVYRDGQQLRKCTAGPHTSITGVTLGPDGLLYAANAASAVLRYNPDTCEYLGIFAVGGRTVIYMTFDDRRNLLVGSILDNSVLRVDRSGGTTVFIAPSSGGLNGTHDFAFVPVAPVARRKQWIAGVGVASGLNGLQFRSSLSINNPNAATADVRVIFTPRFESTPTMTKEFSIAGHQSLFLPDAVDAAGAIVIESGDPVTAWAQTYAVTSRTTVGGIIRSFAEDDLIGAGGTAIAGVADNASVRTNLIAFNAGTVAADVTISASGAATHVTIEAQQNIFIPRVLGALGLDGRSDVTLRVTSSVPGAIYAWASVVDNTSGSATFVEAR